MAKKKQTFKVEKNGKEYDVTDRQFRIFFSNLGYKPKKSGGTKKTTKSTKTTKKDGE